MRVLAFVACLAACAHGSEVRLVRSARVEGLELVVESCNVSVKDNSFVEVGCTTERSAVPVVVDERERDPEIDREEARALTSSIARIREVLAACGGAASAGVMLRIAEDGRAVGADAGAERVDLAACALKALATTRFPKAQRGSQTVMVIAP